MARAPPGPDLSDLRPICRRGDPRREASRSQHCRFLRRLRPADPLAGRDSGADQGDRAVRAADPRDAEDGRARPENALDLARDRDAGPGACPVSPAGPAAAHPRGCAPPPGSVAMAKPPPRAEVSPEAVRTGAHRALPRLTAPRKAGSADPTYRMVGSPGPERACGACGKPLPDGKPSGEPSPTSVEPLWRGDGTLKRVRLGTRRSWPCSSTRSGSRPGRPTCGLRLVAGSGCPRSRDQKTGC